MKNFVAIDFETANAKRSSVCSIGIVIVENGIITDRFYSLIKPIPNYYSYWTTEIHGITYFDTMNSLPFRDVWEEVLRRTKGLPFVAHNSPFDSGCLKAVYEAYDMACPDFEFFCTLRAARKQIPNLANYQLHTVSGHCGYYLHAHHHALADAEACAAIALQIT